MTKFFLSLFFSLLIFGHSSRAQNEPVKESTYRFVFYNIENYFDVVPDTSREYNEFTPEGDRYWSYKKYKTKRNSIYKVITALGGWQPITMIGFAEIENQFVLQDLIDETPLKNDNYKVIHYESIDRRGIDVGLIYHASYFTPIFSNPIKLHDPLDPGFRTRDILYVKGLISTDTIHIFVNHWPSRYGGMLETKGLRQLASQTLKRAIDSVCNINADAQILVMGDFNDNPNDESMLLLSEHQGSCSMQNLKVEPTFGNAKGTLKYMGNWDVFDQILISENMLENEGEMYLNTGNAFVFDADFLLEEDKKYLGVKPYRTFVGYKYNGGFSDHLPIYVDIYQIEE